MIKTRPGEPLGTHFITLPWVRMALGISSISFIFVGSAQAAQALVDRAPPPWRLCWNTALPHTMGRSR